jgi:uncharacterized protein YbjT (DUF2867 family)
MLGRLLLTGASGFVGHHAYPALVSAGWEVSCATRNAEERARKDPKRSWVSFDAERPDSVAVALEGATAVLYLFHAMGQEGDFETKERVAAETFARAAERAGVQRIVYLGGVAPSGEASKHLRSRLSTGEILRASSVSTIELRAGMIVGAGGVSWRMVRDLAARLPFMILPSWLQNRSQPIALQDVVLALVRALELPLDVRGVFDLPGPETLTGEEILTRIARLLGSRPYTVRVPVLTPKLSSYWLKLITGADFGVAQELVEGLTSDLLATHQLFWSYLSEHRPVPFDAAARLALADAAELGVGTRALEWALQHVGRRT